MSFKGPHVDVWASPRHLRLIVLLAGLVALGSATPGLAAALGWPQFRFDASHSGANATETAIGPDNVSTLITAWTGATESSITSSSAAEANGVVYIGSDDGR